MRLNRLTLIYYFLESKRFIFLSGWINPHALFNTEHNIPIYNNKKHAIRLINAFVRRMSV